MVTPCYWGSHWPLSRGKSTGGEVDNRIGLSPAHNSLLTWAMNNRPPPLDHAEVRTLDTRGESKDMLIERWAWLIAMTDTPEAQLLDWAQSFSAPPSVQAEGATLDFDAYVTERRAIRLNISANAVRIILKPSPVTVNPVFELIGVPGDLVSVELDGHAEPASHYVWDGATLWLEATIRQPAIINLAFDKPHHE